MVPVRQWAAAKGAAYRQLCSPDSGRLRTQVRHESDECEGCALPARARRPCGLLLRPQSLETSILEACRPDAWRLAPEQGRTGAGRPALSSCRLPSAPSAPRPTQAPGEPRASQLIGHKTGGTILYHAHCTVRVRAGRIAYSGRCDVDIDLGSALGSCALGQWELPAYLLLIGQISLALDVDPCSSYPSLLGFHACPSPLDQPLPRDRPRRARPCGVLTPHTVATLVFLIEGLFRSRLLLGTQILHFCRHT